MSFFRCGGHPSRHTFLVCRCYQNFMSTAATALYTFTSDLHGWLRRAVVRRMKSLDVEVQTDYYYNDQGIRIRAEQTYFIVNGEQQGPTSKDTHYLIDPANPTGYA